MASKPFESLAWGSRLVSRVGVGLLALCVLGAGCTTPGAEPPLPTTVPYQVGPPDRLQLTILPEPMLERELVVRPDGMISVPLVGDVPAAGRTVEEIAEDIEQRVARFKRDADVTISLLASLSTEITVLGEVGRPSPFPLTRETRIAEAIGLVGGTSLFAAKSRIRVIRPHAENTQVFSVSLSAIEEGDLSQNMVLRAGDIVVVPPTIMASIGYKISEIFFPFGTIFGFGARATTTVVTGGTNRALGF